MRERDDHRLGPQPVFREARDLANDVRCCLGGLQPVVSQEAVSNQGFVSEDEELVMPHGREGFLIDHPDTGEDLVVPLLR